ncbi:hypothetical protein C1646_758520 [Rhizophagus diaphanus]|nr:hypothetical protein C1646_758520 [Rhizophagus diaphanus] [Rhizophagus sp. MUCL 43196]
MDTEFLEISVLLDIKIPKVWKKLKFTNLGFSFHLLDVEYVRFSLRLLALDIQVSAFSLDIWVSVAISS